MIKNGSTEKKKPAKEPQGTPAETIVDVDLSLIRKKRFRLDGDNNRVIELNTSDLSVGIRLEEVYPKLLKMTEEASDKLTQLSEPEAETGSIKLLEDLDQKMRQLVDYVFDSDVASKAAPSGSMYDPINGKFRFEYIIEKLAGLYETNFAQEYELMQKRMDKHTSKYTGKQH